jgi:hypothetical protein
MNAYQKWRLKHGNKRRRRGKYSIRPQGDVHPSNFMIGDSSPYDIVDNTTDGYVPLQKWTFDSFDDSTNSRSNPGFSDLMFGDIMEGDGIDFRDVEKAVVRARKVIAPGHSRDGAGEEFMKSYNRLQNELVAAEHKIKREQKYHKFYDSVVGLVNDLK